MQNCPGEADYHDVYKKEDVRKLMEEQLIESTFERLKALGALADEIGFHAYLVGGFVRDLLLRNETFDVDIVVEGDGIQFAEAIAKRFNAKTRPHKRFGTATSALFVTASRWTLRQPGSNTIKRRPHCLLSNIAR